MKHVFSMVLASCFLVSALARSSALEYCVEKGGSLVDFVQLDKFHRPTNIKKIFCQFKNEGEGVKQVAPDTLANPGPSIALEAFRNAPANIGRTSTPAYDYCIKNLKGLYGNWRDTETGGESGFCAFSDGSLISDWALVYGSKRLPKLNAAFASQY